MPERSRPRPRPPRTPSSSPWPGPPGPGPAPPRAPRCATSDGRTYAAATVDLPSLHLTALRVCVAMAVTSGSRGLEAAVVLSERGPSPPTDLAALRDFAGTGVVVRLGDPKGALRSSSTT